MKTVKFQRPHNPRQRYDVVLSDGTVPISSVLTYPRGSASPLSDNYHTLFVHPLVTRYALPRGSIGEARGSTKEQ